MLNKNRFTGAPWPPDGNLVTTAQGQAESAPVAEAMLADTNQRMEASGGRLAQEPR